MDYQLIDPVRLKVLIVWARQHSNFTSAELGDYVSNIVKIVLNGESFRCYTEDWQLEMFANASLALMNSLQTADLERENLFNYFYTVATNSCKHTLVKLKKDNLLPLNEESEEASNPVMLKQKRKATRGLVEHNEREVIKYVRFKKMVLLQNAVGRAVAVALESMSCNDVNKLLTIARRNREAVC